MHRCRRRVELCQLVCSVFPREQALAVFLFLAVVQVRCAVSCLSGAALAKFDKLVGPVWVNTFVSRSNGFLVPAPSFLC